MTKTGAAQARSFELKVLDDEPGKFVFSAWGNVSMFFWTAPATPDSMVRLARCTEPLYEQNPCGVSNVHVVESGVGLPSAECRELMADLMRRRAERRACFIAVPVGSGFWASTLRSFATGMRLVSPRSFAFAVHSSLQEAADWLPTPHFERTGVRLNRRELLQVLVQTEAHSKRGLKASTPML